MKKVAIYKKDAIPGKVFSELEVQRDAEVGCGFHGSYILRNVKIQKVLWHFNAVGPGSLRLSRVIIEEL